MQPREEIYDLATLRVMNREALDPNRDYNQGSFASYLSRSASEIHAQELLEAQAILTKLGDYKKANFYLHLLDGKKKQLDEIENNYNKYIHAASILEKAILENLTKLPKIYAPLIQEKMEAKDKDFSAFIAVNNYSLKEHPESDDIQKWANKELMNSRQSILDWLKKLEAESKNLLELSNQYLAKQINYKKTKLPSSPFRVVVSNDPHLHAFDHLVKITQERIEKAEKTSDSVQLEEEKTKLNAYLKQLDSYLDANIAKKTKTNLVIQALNPDVPIASKVSAAVLAKQSLLAHPKNLLAVPGIKLSQEQETVCKI